MIRYLPAMLGLGLRVQSPFVVFYAVYGVVVVAGTIWAYGFKRQSHADEAIAGILLAGGMLFVIAYLTLWLLRRPADCRWVDR